MTWQIDTPPNQSDLLGDLTPKRVLLSFDGPKVFEAESPNGQPLLVYWSDEDEDARITRFIVSPATPELLDDLIEGTISLRDAILSSWMWAVDKRYDGTIASVWSIEKSGIPDGFLPLPNLPLNPKHKPLLSVRLVGPNLTKGNIPATVVKRAVDSASNAIKTMLEHLFEEGEIVEEGIGFSNRRFDLRAQSFAFRSFQVSFKKPTLASYSEITSEQETRLFQETSRLLQDGLDWLLKPNEDSFEAYSGTKRIAILEALVALTPPKSGPVHEIEISGDLVGRSPSPLTRIQAEKASDMLLAARQADEETIVLTGKVRMIDLDKRVFSVRDPDHQVDQKCSYDKESAEEALGAFKEGDTVEVTGRLRPNKTLVIRFIRVVRE